MDAIYLDSNASLPFPAELSEELSSALLSSAGNPSSLHSHGRKSRKLINEAAESIASFLGEDAAFLYWTSGASEGNAWVLHSAVARARAAGRVPRILISAIEHESTMLAGRFAAEHMGARVEHLPVRRDGLVDLSDLESKLSSKSPQDPYDLISIMHANNETGVIQPMAAVAGLCARFKAPLHIDAVQALLKIPAPAPSDGIQFLTFSGHKIGAPKGVGFVLVRGEGRLLYPLIHGKQQKKLRGGTENPFAVGLFGMVIEAYKTGRLRGFEHLRALHERFEEGLLRGIPGAIIHGSGSPRLPNTTYVGFEGVEGDGLLMALDLEGISASSGSACSSGSLDPSHVLLAMGCSVDVARSSIRFSSSPATTWADFERVLDVLPEIVMRARGGREG